VNLPWRRRDVRGVTGHFHHHPTGTAARPGGERPDHVHRRDRLARFSLVGYLPILLSVTLFIAVLMTLTRSYRDSEMCLVFLRQGLIHWIRPVLTFALPLC